MSTSRMHQAGWLSDSFTGRCLSLAKGDHGAVELPAVVTIVAQLSLCAWEERDDICTQCLAGSTDGCEHCARDDTEQEVSHQRVECHVIDHEQWHAKFGWHQEQWAENPPERSVGGTGRDGCGRAEACSGENDAEGEADEGGDGEVHDPAHGDGVAACHFGDHGHHAHGVHHGAEDEPSSEASGDAADQVAGQWQWCGGRIEGF